MLLTSLHHYSFPLISSSVLHQPSLGKFVAFSSWRGRGGGKEDNSQQRHNKCLLLLIRRIARYVLPVFLFSILFMVPKFYELRPVEILQNRTTTKVAAAAVASAAHNAGADADDDDGDAAVKEVVTDVSQT